MRQMCIRDRDERLLNTPAMAVERARAATAEMAELARVGVFQAMSLTHKWDDTLAEKIKEEESKVEMCIRDSCMSGGKDCCFRWYS